MHRVSSRKHMSDINAKPIALVLISRASLENTRKEADDPKKAAD